MGERVRRVPRNSGCWLSASWLERSRGQLLGAMLLLACAPQSAVTAMPGLVTHPIDPSAADGGAPGAEYLDRYVGGRSVVQLGESIHITEEFPLVRLQLVRRLHEHHGFDVLAFEGTALGAWLAQDHLYRSRDPAAAARRAQELAWFGLWQTQPMLDVMAYIASTMQTSSPLYLASFDVQPASSRAFEGSAVKALDALFEAVKSYEPLPDAAAPARWRDAIAPLLGCSRSAPPKTLAERQSAELAVAELKMWFDRASPSVASQHGERHARALVDIPSSLRASIELCRRVQGSDMRTYQESRDALNAQRALDLRDHVSLTHQVMLWAHHSHINFNASGKNPVSMGQHLHERLGDELYSIGLFAGAGEALELREGTLIEIAARQIAPASRYGVESLLSGVASGSFFLDLAPLRSNEAWLQPLTARQEVLGRSHIIPARDFDAAIFVRDVHATRLLMISPRIDRLLHVYGWLLDHLLVVSAAAAALLAALAASIVRRVRRRRAQTAEGKRRS
jgi:erythromycin esterase